MPNSYDLVKLLHMSVLFKVIIHLHFKLQKAYLNYTKIFSLSNLFQ